jgi:hypothetical protein
MVECLNFIKDTALDGIMDQIRDFNRRLFTLVISSFLLLGSCGDTSNEERVDNAISLANQLLTDKDCAGAQQVLDDLGYQSLNSEYLIAYASSQACYAGYTTTNLFSNELSKVGSTNSAILGSLTTFSTSSTSSSTDGTYNYILAAVNTLLYSGGISTPSHTNRAAKFNAQDLQEIEVFSLYLMLTLIGKYFYIHGNTDSQGRKGSLDSSETNNCLADYTTTNGQALRAAATGGGSISPCASDADGHSELAAASANRAEYMCQGVVMFNNFVDLVSNVTISGSDTSTIQNLSDAVGTLCDDAGLGDVCTVKSQSECVNTIWTATGENGEDVEEFFVAVFETMLTDS